MQGMLSSICGLGHSKHAFLRTRILAVCRQTACTAAHRSFSKTSPASPTSGALHGIKVLDLSRVLAGPFCTQILADYGAEVIKVEQVGQGDDTRYWRVADESKIWAANSATSCYFAAVNRNKRSLTLDIKSAAGKKILLALAAQADVLVENFIPGKMAQFGLSFEELHAVNERLVYASISGYGASGPYARRAGYDIIAAAEGGLLHITGERDGPPTKPGVALTDICTGLFTHGAILAALQARQRTGKGQLIESSLFETQLGVMTSVATVWLNMQKEASRWGTEHPSIAPYSAFKTSDSWLVCGAVNDRQFTKLCGILGCENASTDERFASNDARIRNRDALKSLLDDAFSQSTTEKWLQKLEGSGMPYGPINGMEQVFKHGQVEARDMIESVPSSALTSGVLKMVGIPVKFSGTRASIRNGPPGLGEHTEDVLRDLGYDATQIADFRAQGVI